MLPGDEVGELDTLLAAEKLPSGALIPEELI